MIKGLDVSSIQGTVPWKALYAKGFLFGIAKCQQGNDFKDPQFESNLTAMKDAGIIPGSYHFAYPLPHLDPVKQAQGFFKASDCGSNVGELPPTIDFEWPAPEEWAKWKCSGKQIAEWFKAHLEAVTPEFGCKPIVYTYPWFIISILRDGGDLSYLADYPLFMADYTFSGREIIEGMVPKIPKPWAEAGKTWTFWQHDGNGGLRLPNGVDSDFCVFNGSLEDLLELAHGPTARYEGDEPGPIIHPIP